MKKARVKSTGEKIEVLSVSATLKGYSTYYNIDEISFIDKPDLEASIDYEQRRWELVKAAMQGLLSTELFCGNEDEEIARMAISQADAVLAEYRKGEKK